MQFPSSLNRLKAVAGFPDDLPPRVLLQHFPNTRSPLGRVINDKNRSDSSRGVGCRSAHRNNASLLPQPLTPFLVARVVVRYCWQRIDEGGRRSKRQNVRSSLHTSNCRNQAITVRRGEPA